jgi:hypothetical protein
MKKFKMFVNKTLVSIGVLALVPSAVAGATPTILVDPYDNIPLTGTTQLHIVGAGLVPDSRISVAQISVAPTSTIEGDPYDGDVKREHIFRGMLQVNAVGVADGYVGVTYDPDSSVTSFPTINYCDTISTLGRQCLLEFYYLSPVSGPLTLQKLYFGMAGPAVTPLPTLTPMTKDDCKDDKWDSFVTLGFKNQGACVSYVANKK